MIRSSACCSIVFINAVISFPSIKTFIATDLIYNSQQQFFPIPQGNTDTVRSHIMDIVGGPVERIDHPTILLIRQASRTLFGNKPCFGKQCRKLFDQTPFGFFIHIRDIIVCTLFLHPLPIELLPFITQKCTGFTGYLPYFCTKVFQVRYSNHRLIFLCSALI